MFGRVDLDRTERANGCRNLFSNHDRTTILVCQRLLEYGNIGTFMKRVYTLRAKCVHKGKHRNNIAVVMRFAL